MTMRLDIVTNDAGELVRREHARDLGAGVVVAIYRLVKLAQLHDLGNQAFLRQLDQTYQMIGEYCLRSGSNVSVLFADKATFVAGQLLKGNRGAYIASAELGELLEQLGGSELHISRDLTRDNLNAFAEQVSIYYRTGSAAGLRLPPQVHLRRVSDAARLRGIELEDLSPDQRIMRAYASAVVIMRRFYDDLNASRYVLPRRIKRIAQSLVDLSDASTASYLGVTEVRNANHDEAGRAVNTAILAVAIARESTQDRITLALIAMAAMMHDVARPRALSLAGAGGSPMPGMAGPTSLSEDQEDRLAAGAAAVLTALGRVNEPSITRTVLTFEALWLRRKAWLGPVYWGARPPTLHASIIAVGRRYNDLLTPEPGLEPPTTDYAVAKLASELTEAQDRTVLRMLVSALGLLPTGTVVQLATGEVAEVVRGARGLGDKPRVKLIADASGAQYPHQVEMELADDPRRTVLRVLSVDGWQKGLELAHGAGGPGTDGDEDVIVSVPPPAPEASQPPPAAFVSPLLPNISSRDAGAREGHRYSAVGDSAPPSERTGRKSESGSGASGEHPSSASMPSLGSSPSAVAEAMGRMINDPLRPPARPPREERPGRSQQPQALDDGGQRSGRPGGREATARGNLAATPLPHVLVYMLDHALTGTVVFEGTNPDPSSGADDTIYFVSGVPAKICLGDSVALLGEVLVEDGALDARSLDQALAGAHHLGILFGEYLVGHDLVSREALAWALEGQLLRKIAHVANLAPEIQYAYYRDLDLLEGWGGEVSVSHPLNPILASVRHWTDRARVRATLNRIGKHPLALHPDSDLTDIALISEEQVVLEAVRADSIPLPQLFKQQLADEEVVSSLIYSLAVTRQFAFKGQKKGPMAARGLAWRSVSPGSGSSAPSSASSNVPSPAVPSPSAPMASGSRPAVPIPAAAAMSSAPPGRAGLPQSQPSFPASSARSAAPAAPMSTGASARPVAPQIRPISVSVKKPTVVGMQPGARDVGGRASMPEDEARTIAIPQGLTARRPPPSARALPLPPPATPAVHRPAVPPGARTSGAYSAARPVNTMKGVAPAPATEDGFSDAARKSAPPRTSSPSSARRGAIEIDDAGLADAEAGVEAMSNFRLAEGALQRNDFRAAELYAKKAVADDPGQADYVTLLAWVRAAGGAAPQTIDEAIRTMSKVLIEDPSNERALFYRAKLLARTNRLPEALHDLSELLAVNPNHRDALNEARLLRTKVPGS